MSHFTVLVIGDDIDKQLAPYNEQPEEDDQACAEFLTWNGTDENGVEYQGDTKQEVIDEATKAGSKIDDGPYYYTSNAKWDWYVIGGRWRGFFKLKPGAEGVEGTHYSVQGRPGHVDQALKGAIDFEGMLNEAAEAAAERWDAAMKIFGEEPEQKSFQEIADNPLHKDLTRDDIREMYWKQPRCVLWNTAKEEMADEFTLGGWDSSPDRYLGDKETYINRCKSDRVHTYAILKDGEWIGKGEMGWFGMSNDEVSDEEWAGKLLQLIEELPDDTLLTLVDCHI